MGFLDRFRVKAKQAEPRKDFYVPSDAEVLQAKLRSWGPEREGSRWPQPSPCPTEMIK